MSETKVCTTCGEEKPATSVFFKKRYNDSKDGLRCQCRACVIAVNEKYKLANINHIREYGREYSRTHSQQYYKNNSKRIKEANSKYARNNAEKFRAYSHQRRARKKLVPATLTDQQWSTIKEYFNFKCAYCGQEALLTQEHFVPLSKGGEYTKDNIIPACQACNCSKQNKLYNEWYPKQIFYNKSREYKILKYLGYKHQRQQLSIF